MTAFAAAIQDTLRMRLTDILLPEKPPATTKAYHLVRCQGEDQLAPELAEREKDHWITLARNTAARGTWGELRVRELKNIGSCLWHGNQPLAEDTVFLTDFLKACKIKLKKSLCNVLIRAYLLYYEKNRLGISLLGKWLAETVIGWDWPWKDRQKEFFLFDGHEAPSVIADMVMGGKESVSDILERCGIARAVQSGGMASSAFAEALRRYRGNAGLEDPAITLTRLKRIVEWAGVQGWAGNEGAKFSSKLKVLFIESLLLPWANSTPVDKIMQSTQAFLLDCFKDPRLYKSVWEDVNKIATAIIRRWLVGRSLEQFLDVVGRLAVAHQWSERRKFWMSYYKKSVISEAWVVFAGNGKSLAERIAVEQNDPSWKNCGYIPGSDYNHAILIMKIGDLTIADFSHNGQCRIYKKGNESAPLLYLDEYLRADMMNDDKADFHKRHLGNWQADVASYIHRLIGV